MIRISKQLLFNPISFWISGIKCTASNISRLVNALNCKWIAMTIDSLSNDSLLLAYIKNQGLRIFVKQHVTNCYEVSVVLPNSLFEGVLEKAISEDPENIFMISLLDPTNEDTYFQYSFEQLVITGIANVFICISFDENAVFISANKALTQPKNLYRRIKALRFD